MTKINISLNGPIVTLQTGLLEVLVKNKSMEKTLKQLLDEQNIKYTSLTEPIGTARKVTSFSEESKQQGVLGRLEECTPGELYYLDCFDEAVAQAIAKKAQEGGFFVVEAFGASFVQNEYLEQHAAAVTCFPANPEHFLREIMYAAEYSSIQHQ